MLRVSRRGPLVPARIWLCDHDPADPANKLDRGRLSIYPRAEIAGRECPPEVLLDRIGVRWSGDIVPPPPLIIAALADPARLTPRPVGHWAYAQPISAGEYRYRIEHIQWLRKHRPNDPRAHPNRELRPADLPLPSFEREQSLVG